MKCRVPILLLLAGILTFTACRRGPDDPVFSIRSRNNRLCGKWQLVSMTSDLEESNFSRKMVFDGDSATFTEIFSNNTSKSAMALFYTVEFKKDGDAATVLRESSSVNQESTFPWHWVDQPKRKGAVNFNMQVDQISNNSDWKIKELSYDQLVITNDFQTASASFFENYAAEATFRRIRNFR